MAEGQSPAIAWVRGHIKVVAGVAAGVVVLLVVVIVLASTDGGGSGGAAITPGAIVGSEPLTSGYRIAGKVTAVGAASVTITITDVESASPDARNVVLMPGQTLEFDQPANGAVALARNNHRIAHLTQIHKGDKVVLVGEFTDVVVPPAAPHQGYAFIGLEATS